MSSKWPDLIGSAAADIVSALGIPGSNFAGTALSQCIQHLLEKRAAQSGKILEEELPQERRSAPDPGEAEEFAAILYRYHGKALEGAARLNLRLMARVIRGQLEGPGLNASAFLRYSDILARLTREEVILLATRHAVKVEFDAKGTPADWTDTSVVNGGVKTRLVPKVFPTQKHLDAAMTALQRTGLIWPSAASQAGGPIWQDTPLLDELVSLAQFQEALDKEATPQP